MIGSILGTAGGGLLQVGSVIGGLVGSKKMNDLAQAELSGRKAENEAWYNQRKNEDYLMRTDVQNTLRKQRELLNEQYKRAKATNIVAGGTDESLALQQQASNDILGDTMADIASNASAFKDNIEAQYRQEKSNLSSQQQAIYDARAKAIAEAAGQASKMGGKLMGVGLEGLGEAIAKKEA